MRISDWSSDVCSSDLSADERELRAAGRKEQMRKLLKDNPAADVSHLRTTEDPEPSLRRYKAVDCSYQALGELLRPKSNGTPVPRDELMSLQLARASCRERVGH